MTAKSHETVVADQFGLKIVTHQGTTQFQHMQCRLRLRMQPQAAAANQVDADGGILQHDVMQNAAIAQFDVADQGGQMHLLATAHVLLDQGQLGAFTQLDHVACMPGQINFGGCTHKHQLHRRGDFHVGGDAQHYTIARSGGIDTRKRITCLAVMS